MSAWSAPQTVPRLWVIHELGPVEVGPVLGLYRGTEAELLSWLPPGPYAWRWS